ncbi:hypothetical protein FO519_002384 [Halicephalobus sp. NKZ332]|nr:hypothetical protein FO519_002384 [Halicephalobus sp. NKZ332]
MLLLVQVDGKRGTRVNIYKQKGGDITQLRQGPEVPPGTAMADLPNSIMYNALPSDSRYRWTVYTDSDGNYLLPYIITGSFDSEEQQIIAGAMRAIENNTCVRFVKRTNQPEFLDLQNKRNQGCYTTVGRQPGRNVVMLEANNIATCVEHDIVVHELMHTLGLWHEHMRNDRDNFIKVHYENIETAYYPQFDKIPTNESTTYGVTYDYRSVMHYAKDAFGVSPNVITMETLDPAFQNVIGKVSDAAPSDYLKICSIYSCKTCMGKEFSPDTIAEYEASLKTGGTVKPNVNSTTKSSTLTPSSSTRATRILSSTVPSLPPVVPSSSTLSPECTDRFFCSTILNAWNKDFMCRMRSVLKWCCLTCSGNNQQSPWFKFGLAD